MGAAIFPKCKLLNKLFWALKYLLWFPVFAGRVVWRHRAWGIPWLLLWCSVVAAYRSARGTLPPAGVVLRPPGAAAAALGLRGGGARGGAGVTTERAACADPWATFQAGLSPARARSLLWAAGASPARARRGGWALGRRQGLRGAAGAGEPGRPGPSAPLGPGGAGGLVSPRHPEVGPGAGTGFPSPGRKHGPAPPGCVPGCHQQHHGHPAGQQARLPGETLGSLTARFLGFPPGLGDSNHAGLPSPEGPPQAKGGPPSFSPLLPVTSDCVPDT